MINKSTIQGAMFNIFNIDDNIPVYKLKSLETKANENNSYKKTQLQLKGINEKSLLDFIDMYGENAMFVNNYQGVVKITDDYAIKYTILNRDDAHNITTLQMTPMIMLNPGIPIPVSKVTFYICAKNMETDTNHGIHILNNNKDIAINLIKNNKFIAEAVKEEVTKTVTSLLSEFKLRLTQTFIQEQVKLLLSAMTMINYTLSTRPVTKHADSLYHTADLIIRNTIKPVFIKDKSGTKIKMNPYKILQKSTIKTPV